jgi:hypothetical protein
MAETLPIKLTTPTPAGPTAPGHASPAAPPTSKSFGDVLRAIGEETKRGEAIVQRAIDSRWRKDFSGAELLALQAGVYRYSEVVDLASKLVDRVAQGVKSIVQSGGS